ncbi:MAG: glycosyltransferase family A protein [bacterium]|nr:glycosyltransferase family A protein [bacterium]
MNDTHENVPELSVVVASATSAQDLTVFLDALLRQCDGKDVEVIVSNCCQDDSLHGMDKKTPGVSFIQFDRKDILPTLWGAGIERSRGRIIAVTDTTCPVEEGWVDSVLEAHESPHPVIGGAVEIGTCKRWVDWTAYFCEYAQFMRPLRDGYATELPGNNVSFKRSALQKGSEFTTNGFWKSYWCQRLQAEGIRLVSVPSIVVRYNKSYELMPFMVRRFHHGRCFAGMRFPRSSVVKRVAYAVGSLLLPFVSLARIMRAVLPKKRYRWEFWVSFPVSVLAVVTWSAGELCGYVAGTGNSCAHIY